LRNANNVAIKKLAIHALIHESITQHLKQILSVSLKKKLTIPKKEKGNPILKKEAGDVNFWMRLPSRNLEYITKL